MDRPSDSHKPNHDSSWRLPSLSPNEVGLPRTNAGRMGWLKGQNIRMKKGER